MKYEEAMKIVRELRNNGGMTCPYPDCQRPFKSDKDYRGFQKHVNSQHENVKDLICTECKYATAYSKNLLRHMKKAHNKPLPFRCSECKYSGTCISELQAHIKTRHDKICDYKCSRCNYSTSFQASLKTHTKLIHEQLRLCGYCGFSTKERQEMREHKIIHKKDNGKAVIKQWLSNGPYACFNCEYSTSVRRSLKSHIQRVHLKVRTCELCTFSTNEREEMTTHQIVVHNNKELLKRQCKREKGNNFQMSLEIPGTNGSIKSPDEEDVKNPNIIQVMYPNATEVEIATKINTSSNEGSHIEFKERTQFKPESNYLTIQNGSFITDVKEDIEFVSTGNEGALEICPSMNDCPQTQGE